MDKLTIFHKVVLFIILLLIPIVSLYFYSNQVSVSVVQSEIRDSISRRLSFFQNRLNLQIDQVSRGAFQLGSDPALKSYESIMGFESYFDAIESKKRVEERIIIQNNLSDWPTDITVYFPKLRVTANPTTMVPYDDQYLLEQVMNRWQTRKSETTFHPQPLLQGLAQVQGQTNVEVQAVNEFYFYAVGPYSGYFEPLKADHIVEIKFTENNLIRMLDDYKKSGEGDPFLFHGSHGVIPNRTSNRELMEQVAALLAERELVEFDSFPAELNGGTYLVHYIQDKSLGWTIIDYVPMQQVLSPIVNSNRLFYISTLTLLLMSIFAAFMLYRHVQIPIRTLVRSLRLVKNGDFSTRISVAGSSEFNFVFQRFNEMIQQIQELIENVYNEQLRSRDAQLKQLQSQINPHFLYNCLYYIVNMARLERLEPIERMAINLGSFFKYTTRLEKPDTVLRDELQLITNYLEIQKLRMSRIDYSIEVPEGMMALEIPRLLLQPIVENAVIHGIEPKPGGGKITIAGGMDEMNAWIIIEDNGIGMPADKAMEMNRQLEQPVSETMGYGVWNVHQRMLLRYGPNAGVTYRSGPNVGCTVTMTWNPRESAAQERSA